ncbi:hypothetical protein GPLA_3984 [Paraglaciecola polaris LMG 21857]|uniref:Uncharacterized protein n=1 Tax=Paraglaciecola polaris LMG 21857 TaxID=1129793 RepID=K7A1R1_9ALTE|nr:hypothetical protein GPLA_3984 [Paraglaciecola polaris LMG 21857]
MRCIKISIAGTWPNNLKYIGAIPHMVYAAIANKTPDFTALSLILMPFIRQAPECELTVG